MAQQGYISPEELQDILDSLPRVRLALTPTPLEECKRLAAELVPSGARPTIYVKRDDLTGPGLGGNKIRHLEFRLGDAVNKACDTFIYVDDANAARAAGAACAKVGLDYVQVVPAQKLETLTPNLMLSGIFGAEMHYVPVSSPLRTEAHDYAARIENQLREKGRKPYRVQAMSWFNLSAVVSYLMAVLEMKAQLDQRRVYKAQIFMVTGHSHAGVQLAAKLLGLPWTVVGIGVDQVFEPDLPMAEWSRQTAELLNLPTYLNVEEVVTDYGYSGPGYHKASTVSVAAVQLMGRTEGMVLDPAYTGKAMAAMVDHVRRGDFDPETAIIFIHTGGLPMLFENSQLFE